MKTAFTEELRLWSIKFMCEPLSHGISDCEYAGELLQRAQHFIETTLDVSKPNCTECAKWAKEQAENREWIAGVKKGREIVEKMAKAVIGKTITETEAPTSLFELWWAEYLPEATQARAFEAWNAAPRADITRSIK
jgi:hypothetical protein